MSTCMALTTTEREVLDLERDWWRSSPTKKQAIEARLCISPGGYYAILRRLARSPDAFGYDPLVVQRVRRRLAEGRRVRIEGVTAAAVPYRPSNPRKGPGPDSQR